jgi:RimJ/RimL family protein N-acetyltransferase
VQILETERLVLRQLSTASATAAASGDAAFILELLNEPPFLQNIGDRGVRNLEDAYQYIENGPISSYAKFGFGLYLVELKKSAVSIGICGLIKRDFLDAPDIGFAFLQRHWSQGYAYESSSAVMDYAHNKLGLNRILAITALENPASINLLHKLGLRFDKIIESSPTGEKSRLFSSKFSTPSADTET